MMPGSASARRSRNSTTKSPLVPSSDQSPAAGAKVAVGTAVNLTVSKGPAGVVTVPNVTGQSETVAQSILQNAGLTIGTTTKQPDPAMQAGNVIQTTPAAGEQVEIGTAVDLVISDGFSGPQQCVVPDVTGQTVENAREICSQPACRESAPPPCSVTVPYRPAWWPLSSPPQAR
jgi:hypothetical protein